MLRKLLKHEFRATARIMGPLYIILLLTAVGSNVAIRIMDHSPSKILNVLASLMVVAFSVAIMAVCIMSVVLMIQRFYKNLMGDEGYVMFTLPASTHQQIWSKLIVSSVWFIATGVAVVLAAIIMAFDVHAISAFMTELRNILNQITAVYALNGTAIVLETLLLLFLSCAAICLQFYAAMAVGHSFANHKVLLSVVAYFGSQFVLQFLGSVLLMGVNGFDLFHWILDFSGMQTVHLVMGLLILGMVVYGAIFYIITAFTLKKHLNLE